MRFLLIVHHNETNFAAKSDKVKRTMLAESVAVTHKLNSRAQYIDASPLMPSMHGARVSVRNDRASVTDGPFVETHEHIAGYFFIRAKSLKAAVAVAKTIPGARLGYVEVREVREIGGLPESEKIEQKQLLTPPPKSPTQSVAQVVNAAPARARTILRKIRAMVKAIAPDAEEIVSYQMPAFRQGRVFFYYGAFKNHIGIYPPVKSNAALAKDLKPYLSAKGNLRLPLDQPMPYALIRRVAVALKSQYAR